jgi:hypothetical protein
MLSSEKRADFLSSPRDGKEGETEEPPPAASLVALPRGGARRRLLAQIAEAGTAKDVAAEPPPPAVAAEEPAAEDSVLVSKGGASASGFRPWYWSYERDGGPPVSDSAASMTPYPAGAPSSVSPLDPVSAPATSAPEPRRARRLALIAGGSALALIAGAGIFILRPLLSPPAPAPAAPALAVAVPPAAPALAVAAPPPVPVASAPPPVAAPPPAAAAPKPAPAPKPVVSQAEMDELMARGQQMLATGDIVAARLFFERAAEAGNAAAATAAGKTYDPFFIADTHARGIRGDPVAAARWYRQASAGGDHEADALMKRLMANYAG